MKSTSLLLSALLLLSLAFTGCSSTAPSPDSPGSGATDPNILSGGECSS